MQKFKEEIPEQAPGKKEILREIEIDLHPHFEASHLLYLPERMRIQAILSMFDLIHCKCGKALEKLFPYLFSIGRKRYNIYVKVLSHYEEIEDSNDCLNKMLKWMKPYIREKFKINKNKLKKAVNMLEKGEINDLDMLYNVLPRKVFMKLKKFDSLEGMNFSSKKEKWTWFLKKEIEMLELEE